MSKDKEVKTNAMRILDRNKVKYKVNTYECDEFIDGIHIADMLGQPYESSFKTLVTVGKSGNYYVFAIPIAEELDMKKAAKSVGEKSVEMLHVKDINSVTGYIRGGCTRGDERGAAVGDGAVVFNVFLTDEAVGAEILGHRREPRPEAPSDCRCRRP